MVLVVTRLVVLLVVPRLVVVLVVPAVAVIPVMAVMPVVAVMAVIPVVAEQPVVAAFFDMAVPPEFLFLIWLTCRACNYRVTYNTGHPKNLAKSQVLYKHGHFLST